MRNSVLSQTKMPSGVAFNATSESFSHFNPNPLFVFNTETNKVVLTHLVEKISPDFKLNVTMTAESFLCNLPESNINYSELWNQIKENKIPTSKKVFFKENEQCYLVSFVSHQKEEQLLVGMSWTDISNEEARNARSEKWMRRFKNIYDSCPLGVVTSKPDGSLIANQAFCNWIGYSKDELQCLNKDDISHPEDKKVHVDTLKAIKSREKDFGVFEKRYISKSGHVLLANVHFSGSFNEDGTLQTIIAVVEDITEKKVTEQRLKHSLMLLESIFDNSPVGINFTSPNGRYLKINKKFAEMIGAPESEIIGAHYQSLTHPEDFSKEDKLLSELHDADSDSYHIQKRYVNNNGRSIWASVSVSEILNEDGSIKFFLSIVKDITRERETENQLRKNIEDLRKKSKEVVRYADSNKQLEIFAFAASHDLKEPIRTITNFATILQRKCKEKLDVSEQEYLNFIISGAKNMSQLVEDILCYSKVDTEKGQVNNFCPTELMENILQGIGRRISETKAEISYENFPDQIYGMRIQIKQLFQNLITNALKFQKPGEVPKIEIIASEQSSHYRFSFCDNGIGIEPEYLESIFKLFHKLHAKAEYQGSGIGLSLCQKIVKKHGGKIWAESKVGRGTKFIFTLEK